MSDRARLTAIRVLPVLLLTIAAAGITAAIVLAGWLLFF